MRKSGPFRSIRVCAYTAVGADAGGVRTVVAADDIAGDTAEAAGWLASLVDRRCHTTKPSKSTQTNMRTERRPRIRIHLMGTVASQKYTDYGMSYRSGREIVSPMDGVALMRSFSR